MQKTGVVFITTGGAAREFFARQVEAGSYRFLDKFPTTVLDERALTEQYEGCAIKQSKSLKTRLHSLSPYDYTLYLDIDVKVTRPLGEELLTPLERGYDFVWLTQKSIAMAMRRHLKPARCFSVSASKTNRCS